MAARPLGAASIVVPAATRRPGSASFGDVYGGLDFGLTTARAGSNGAARSAPEPALLSSTGLRADFFRQPAGVLVALVGIIAVWSYLDR